MGNINAEKVISELRKNDSCYAEDIKAIQNAIALINSQEQRIGELTEENERLKWENSHLECIGEVALKNRDEYEQELHYLSNVEIPYLYEALEGKGKDADKLLDILSNALKKSKADTVRKMQERLKAETIAIQDHTGKLGLVVLESAIDQIAKEMLEEET